MNISQFLDQTIASLKKVDWEQVTKDLINLWVTFFKVSVALVIITYLIGKTFSHWVHRTNDWLAHHWVRLIVPQTPIMEEEENEEDEEAPLPTPLVEDPLESPIEVELMLPPIPLVVEIPKQQEQPPPAPPRRRRRQSTPPTAVVVTEELELLQKRLPRGRRALQERKKNRQAA